MPNVIKCRSTILHKRREHSESAASLQKHLYEKRFRSKALPTSSGSSEEYEARRVDQRAYSGIMHVAEAICDAKCRAATSQMTMTPGLVSRS